MVGGIEKFREAFAQFSDNFVIIGGAACDEILDGSIMQPRATLDIDIIVIVENMTAEFAKAFWQFIAEGKYRPGIRKNADKSPKYVLYSFDGGKPGYPVKIELLSHHNEIFTSTRHIEPVPIDGEVSSLSAIILDEPYYQMTIANSYISKGLRYASLAALIALKARAHLNLLAERESGHHENTKDIIKHRNDVLKLVVIADDEPTIVDNPIIETIQAFHDLIVSTLPSQSLQDVMRMDDDAIKAILERLVNLFVAKQ